jgi:dicarboxylate transporter 10
MQTLRPKDDSKRPSTFTVIRYSITKGGFRSLYTGLSASLLRQMTYSLVRIGSYEEMKRRMAKTGSSSTGKLLLAASVAGGLGGIAGNPAGKFVKASYPVYSYFVGTCVRYFNDQNDQ